MAVPPAPSVPAARLAGLARVNRLPFAADVVVGLLTVIGLPLAIVAIPNTISVVSALLPPDIAGVGILRAHGLALPVMLCAVPLAGAVLRRVRPGPLLLAGLALLAVADVAGGYAGSTVEVGVLRVLHGVGAGVLVPATFAAVWERPGPARRVLLPLWTAALCASLLTAQALALWPLDDVTSWRVTLQPYPLLTGVALALAAVHLAVARLGDAEAGALARGAVTERGHLALAAGPSAGIAVLAVGTTFNWPSELILVAAAVAVVTLVALACVRRAGGFAARMAGLVMVAVGLVVLPTTAQMTYVELGGLGGPGLSGLWAPFALATLLSFVAASVVVRLIAPQRPDSVSGAEAAYGNSGVQATVDPGQAGTPLLRTADGEQSVTTSLEPAASPAGSGDLDGSADHAGAGGLVGREKHAGREKLAGREDHAGREKHAGPENRAGREKLVGLEDRAGREKLASLEDHAGREKLASLEDRAGREKLASLEDRAGREKLVGRERLVGLEERAGEGPASRFVAGGLVAVVAALCAVRLLVPSATGLPLVVPLVLLAVGAAVAVSAAVVLAGPHAGLLGLSLCFPAVLGGFLLGTGIQVGWLRSISASGKVTSQAMVDGFVGALHVWSLVAGFVVVAILVLGAVLRRRDPAFRPPRSPRLAPVTPLATAEARAVRGGDTVSFPAITGTRSPTRITRPSARVTGRDHTAADD
ncbi:hypothetical protein [Sphaerisporangium aureirubrum]|uniref:MFS transporter n=1 Tax=Sphaerisporangium aureirubrum TaxID=1544736 RepID=A0ABW1N9I9_9ACTN